MCLWTALIVIANQHPFNTPAFREIGCVFKVGDINLFNYCLLTNMAAVNHNITSSLDPDETLLNSPSSLPKDSPSSQNGPVQDVDRLHSSPPSSLTRRVGEI